MNAPIIEKPPVCHHIEAAADELAVDRAMTSLPRVGRVAGAVRGAVYEALREIEDTDGYVLNPEMSAARSQLKASLAAEDRDQRARREEQRAIDQSRHRHIVVSRDELPDPDIRTRDILAGQELQREEREDRAQKRQVTREEELERFLARMQSGPFRMRHVAIQGASSTVTIEDGVFELRSQGFQLEDSDPRSDGTRIHPQTRIRGTLQVVSGRMVNTDPEAAPGYVSIRGVSLAVSGVPHFDEEGSSSLLRAA